jgi:hypothetical protein
VVKVFKTDLDNIRDEIILLNKKLEKKKGQDKTFGRKKRTVECHNQMIDTNNNQLNRNNIFLLEKMRNMDKQID